MTVRSLDSRKATTSMILRAAVMALAHAGGQTLMAHQRAVDPTAETRWQAVVLGLLTAVAVVWGAAERWLGSRATAMTWFLAGLVAGPTAGFLGWLGQATLVDSTGAGELPVVLTGGAAFTALIIMGPALVGRAAGVLVRSGVSTSHGHPDSGVSTS